MDKVFSEVNRSDFLPDDVKSHAFIDTPLPIGHSQTNSQPTTVRKMLEWLEPDKGEKILDVGSGTGWTTALLSHLVGPSGTVYAVEKIPELAEFGARNCKKANIKNAHFFEADGMFGLPEYAPYDRILVSASSPAVPPWLLTQLRPGGKMVIPVQNDILEVTKISKTEHKTIEHHGYTFVPLI